MIYDTKDLIKLYFKQLTVGCECGSCDNDTCKTCRSFKYKFDNPNETAVEAIHLTLRHPANPRLCDNMPKNIDFDGIIITKLDGTSKGGALFSIVNELNIPILYIGIGERENDLIPFDSKEYVRILLDSIYQGH